MHSVLFVDDEPRILTGLRRMLRSLRHEWEMVFAAGSSEALEHLESQTFDVVVSDARMPFMEGSELLKEVRRLYPDSARFILSGQCSRESVMKCVGVAHQFLSKPCDPDYLRSSVRRVCTLRDQIQNRAARAAASRLQSLPSHPTAHAALQAELESQSPSLEAAAQIIGSDVAMTAKTIQLVSSGFFGTLRHVSDPAEPAKLLGLDTLQELFKSGVAFISGSKNGFEHPALASLNTYARSVAEAARAIVIATQDDAAMAADAFVAGFLLDIDLLALAAHLQDEQGSRDACDANDCARVDACPIARTDRAVGAGCYLAALWGLSDPILRTIASHRRPLERGENTFGILTAVHAAAALLAPTSHQDASDTLVLDEEYLASVDCLDRLPEWNDICMAYRQEGSIL